MAEYKPEPHKFKKLRRIPWEFCTGCGLLRLHNALTDWCVRQGCNHDEHPGYPSAVRALGRPAPEATS